VRVLVRVSLSVFVCVCLCVCLSVCVSLCVCKKRGGSRWRCGELEGKRRGGQLRRRASYEPHLSIRTYTPQPQPYPYTHTHSIHPHILTHAHTIPIPPTPTKIHNRRLGWPHPLLGLRRPRALLHRVGPLAGTARPAVCGGWRGAGESVVASWGVWTCSILWGRGVYVYVCVCVLGGGGGGGVGVSRFYNCNVARHHV
jgi:hypothetical protein